MYIKIEFYKSINASLPVGSKFWWKHIGRL